MTDPFTTAALVVSLAALAVTWTGLRHLRRTLSIHTAALLAERRTSANQAALAELACTSFALMIRCLPEGQIMNRAAFLESSELAQMLLESAPELAGGRGSGPTREWPVAPALRTLLRVIAQADTYSAAIRSRALRGSLDDAFAVAVALAYRAMAPNAESSSQQQRRAA